MKKYSPHLFSFLLLAFLSLALSAQKSLSDQRWRDLVHDQPDEWFSSDEAGAVAENVLLYQRDIGGWPKNTPIHRVVSDDQKEDLLELKSSTEDVTTDNGAIYTEMVFLSRIYKATKQEKYKESFLKALNYLFEAQYENGGWPQYYPMRKGYYTHITFNDNSMVNIMNIMKGISTASDMFSIIADEKTRMKASEAYKKGLDIILKTQYVKNGELTVWCAQHDEVSLEPAKARSYELPSLSGSESAGIVLLLMEIDHPSPEIILSVQSAVKWFDEAKVSGIRIENYTNMVGERDRRVVADPDAPDMWGRFCELSDNRPFFCSRDGIKKYSLEEISHERRNGYGWYSDSPQKVLKEYKIWQPLWAPSDNVLSKQISNS